MSHTFHARTRDYCDAALDHASRTRRHSGRVSDDLRRTQRLDVVDDQPRLAIPASEWTDAQLARLLADVEGGR